MHALGVFRSLLVRVSLVVPTVGASLVLAAPAPRFAQSAAQGLPTLRLDYYADQQPLTFDPALGHVLSRGSAPVVGGTSDWETLALVDATLVHVLPNGKVAPDLATWTVSKNHLVYSFTIKPNARFSNGHPVTAADAAFSIERTLAPATHSGVAMTYLGLIRGARTFHAGETNKLSGLSVLGKRVLQITISKPAAYFLASLSVPPAAVLDPAVVTGKPLGFRDAKTGAYKGNYLTDTCSGNQGAGPFMFLCRSRTSINSFYPSGRTPVYTLVPDPYYYGRQPHIRIELPVLNGPVASYGAYLASKLDAYGIEPGGRYLGQWRGRKELHEYPSGTVVWLTPNTLMPPFDNVHCRLAVSYAIDLDVLNNQVLRGTERSTYAVVPKGILGYYPGNDNPHYNQARARLELARCPHRTVPFRLTIATPFQISSTAIVRMLRRVGMNVKLEVLSVDGWLNVDSQSLGRTHTQLVVSVYGQDYPDPQDFCTLLLRSGQPYDVGGWHSPRYDSLVDRADVTFDRKKRAQLYIQAQHIALSQGAWISWSYLVNFVLLKPYVHGMVGTEAYADMVPANLDWAKVSISKH